MSADANTLFLIPLNNDFIDYSVNNLTVVNTNVTFSNSSPQFSGTYYGVFNGSNAYLNIASSSVFDLSNNNFTFDFWFNFSNLSDRQFLFCQGNEQSGANFNLACNYFGGTWSFDTYNSGFVSFLFSFTPSVNTWYHLAFVRNGTSLLFFINGVQQGSSENIGSFTFSHSTLSFYIGNGYGNSGPNGDVFVGDMQEFRISNIARWTTNFIPPTMPYSIITSTGSKGMFTLLR